MRYQGGYILLYDESIVIFGQLQLVPNDKSSVRYEALNETSRVHDATKAIICEQMVIGSFGAGDYLHPAIRFCSVSMQL